MLYAPLTTLLSASFIYFATAAGVACPSPNQQCCRVVNPASEPVTTALLNCLGVSGVPQNLGVGVTCVPHVFISDIFCDGELVCCTDNNHGGTVALGCTAPSDF
ncbi:hypothetical protein BD779DRAFT_1542069, partial [Infundibulicybe gibba]